TNTLSVISLRTSCATAAGAASRSSSVRPKDCPHSKSTPAPGTMLRPNKTGPENRAPITPASARESLPPELSITPRRPRPTSLMQDQVFVVNFNDVDYLDTPGDFAANIEDLKSALDKIDSRGGTALYDAVHDALDHMKLGNRDKKVLLVITDGEDNASRYTF